MDTVILTLTRDTCWFRTHSLLSPLLYTMLTSACFDAERKARYCTCEASGSVGGCCKHDATERTRRGCMQPLNTSDTALCVPALDTGRRRTSRTLRRFPLLNDLVAYLDITCDHTCRTGTACRDGREHPSAHTFEYTFEYLDAARKWQAGGKASPSQLHCAGGGRQRAGGLQVPRSTWAAGTQVSSPSWHV